MSGYGTSKVDLSIVDPGSEEDGVEVWKAIFVDEEDNTPWEVYFEMQGDYEVWDLVNEAILVYRDTIDQKDPE